MKRDDEPIISINIILIGLVLLLIVLGVLSFVNILVKQYTGHIMEWGSVSDWVSTGCNVVMALSAGYAALNAQKWFSTKKVEYTALKVEKIITNATTLVALLNAIKSNIEDKCYDKLREKPRELIISYGKFNASRIVMLTWGNNILKDDFKKYINELKKNAFHVYEIIKNDKFIPTHNNERPLNELSELSVKISRIHSQFVNEFDKENFDIQDLFKINF